MPYEQIPAIGQRAMYRSDEHIEQQNEGGVKNETGRKIYLAFNLAVRLQEQWRVKDKIWQDMLAALRGKKKWLDSHTALLRSLILPITPKQKARDMTRYDQADKWHLASLITPRKLNRDAWNTQAVAHLAAQANQAVLTFAAEDSIKGERLSLAQRLAVLNQSPKQQVVSESFIRIL